MKVYGFIHGEDDKDVFVHRSSIPFDTQLYAEDQVEYEVEDSEKGQRAINVKKIKNAS